MKEFKCDCGFKWIKGNSAKHQCGPFYKEKVDGLKQELAAAKAVLEAQCKTYSESLPHVRANAVIDAKNGFIDSGLLIGIKQLVDFFDKRADKLRAGK